MVKSNTSFQVALLLGSHLSHHVLLTYFEMPLLLDLDPTSYCLLLRVFALTFCSTSADTKS